MIATDFNADHAREFARLYDALSFSRWRLVVRRCWEHAAANDACPRWYELPPQFMWSEKSSQGNWQLAENIIVDEGFDEIFDENIRHTSLVFRGDLWRPYQSDWEKRFFLRKHRRVARRLTEGTAFQNWLSNQPNFGEALAAMKRKSLAMELHSLYEGEYISEYEDFTLWALQFVVTRALLAYHRYGDYPEGLRELFPDTVPNYSENARRYARKLRQELISLGIPFPGHLYAHLSQIESSDFLHPLAASAPTKKSEQERRRLTEIQRRSLYIRELAVLGNRYLFSTRGKTQRFPADVVKILCRLVTEHEPSDSTINEVLARMENEEEPAPFTHSNRIDTALPSYY